MTFQRETVVIDRVDHDLVLLVAPRDLEKGEGLHLWAGPFSNSEIAMRMGSGGIKGPNAVGYGHGSRAPANWNIENRDSEAYKEYAR